MIDRLTSSVLHVFWLPAHICAGPVHEVRIYVFRYVRRVKTPAQVTHAVSQRSRRLQQKIVFHSQHLTIPLCACHQSFQVCGQVLRGLKVRGVDEGVGREVLLVVCSPAHNWNDVDVVEHLEELLRHVVSTQGVFERKVEVISSVQQL